MPQLKLAMPSHPNPNQLSDEEHKQLHDSPPNIDYNEIMWYVRDWIMQYEGYELFKQILFDNGVSQSELNAIEGGADVDVAPTGARMDELHTLYNAAEDRAYLIVIIKLYQMAVGWAPRPEYPTRPQSAA